MGSWFWKCTRASSKSVKCSRVEVGRYVPVRGVFLLVMTSQITIIGPWKRVDSLLQPWGRSRTTRPTPPCASTAAVVIFCEYTTFDIILLRQ